MQDLNYEIDSEYVKSLEKVDVIHATRGITGKDKQWKVMRSTTVEIQATDWIKYKLRRLKHQ